MCTNKINPEWEAAAGCTAAYPVQYWQREHRSQLWTSHLFLLNLPMWCCSTYEHFPLDLISTIPMKNQRIYPKNFMCLHDIALSCPKVIKRHKMFSPGMKHAVAEMLAWLYQALGAEIMRTSRIYSIYGCFSSGDMLIIIRPALYL